MDEDESPTDWAGIQREYRAGASLRSIAAQFGISHMQVKRKAKECGWPQDLSERVRIATQTKLACTPIADSDPAIEVAVEEAADERVKLVRSHQQQFARLQRIAATLATRTEQILAGEYVELPCLGERESPADLLRKVASVTTTVVDAQRRSFGLDAPIEKAASSDGSTPVLDGLLRELAGRRARMEATEMQEDGEEGS
jgi:hypothetical protein